MWHRLTSFRVGFCIVLVAVLVTGGTALFMSLRHIQPQTLDDADLVAAIRSAVTKKVPFSEIETAVGAKSLLNTFSEGNRFALSMISLGRDESNGEADLPFLDHEDNVVDIVCWTRPSPNRTNRLVGVYSDKNGNHHLFFAERLLPG
ncbi:MAG: hypothetical protein WCL32_22875 [Planctomycetota bacterium]